MSANGDSAESQDALKTLCDRYYEPVLAYLNKTGLGRDVAHDFFAYLLESNRLENLQRGQGRFRSYLLGALKHFLSHRRAREKAAKRGGGTKPISLNETGVEASGKSLPPDVWFDQQWAMTLLSRALNQVETECREAGNEIEFQHLSPWLTGEAEHGAQAELAKELGIPPNTLKSTISRLRKRFRAAVKAEISETLADGADVEKEMQALFSALSGNIQG